MWTLWHISGQKAGPLGFVGGLLYCSKLRLSSRLNKANYFIIRSDLLATSKLLSAQKQRRRPQRENSREMKSLSYVRISLPLKAGITVHSLHWQTVNLPTWTSLNQDMFPIHTHTWVSVILWDWEGIWFKDKSLVLFSYGFECTSAAYQHDLHYFFIENRAAGGCIIMRYQGNS